MTQRRHPSRRYSGPVRLDRLAKDCLGKVVARQGFGSAEILTAWAEIVGPELATRSRPERIRWPRRTKDKEAASATLVVRAEGGDALEIQHMTDEILSRLNGFLGWGAVGRLIVRQAPVAIEDPGQARAKPAPSSEPASFRRAGPALGRIADTALRDALARLDRVRAEEEDNLP